MRSCCSTRRVQIALVFERRPWMNVSVFQEFVANFLVAVVGAVGFFFYPAGHRWNGPPLCEKNNSEVFGSRIWRSRIVVASEAR